MKVIVNTPDRLVFQHTPVGLGLVIGVGSGMGIAAGAAAISMHERWSLADDFVRIGVGLLAASLGVGLLLTWTVVRRQRLSFDRTRAEVRIESLGLGAARVRTWPLDSLRDVEVSETYLGGTRRIHATRLCFADGTSHKLGKLDPPTVQAIERNVAVIRDWLERRRDTLSR